jgi:NAD(P)-dependent dehydrogenase (short-subunit alcohol dehydrogenase family)
MKKKIVLITGSSSGFGRLLVEAFLTRDWIVLGSLRNAQRAEEIFHEEIDRYRGRFFPVSLDVARKEDHTAVSEFLAREFGGRLDCLINNAGYGLFGVLEELSEQQIRDQMEVNFFGPALLTRRLLPQLRASRGRIINISSVMGYFSMPHASMYAASKYALEALSEALYHELKPHGVQVALVEPGGFRTDFGRNQQWGEANRATGSPYSIQNENFARYRERRGSGPGNPPGPVIDAVVRLAELSTMPLRVRCGADAKFLYGLKRLTPEWIQTLLFSTAFHRMFVAPKAK